MRLKNVGTCLSRIYILDKHVPTFLICKILHFEDVLKDVRIKYSRIFKICGEIGGCTLVPISSTCQVLTLCPMTYC